MKYSERYNRHKSSPMKEHISNEEIIPAFELNLHFVYVLYCPIDKRIKYVGYTSSAPWDRLTNHMSNNKCRPSKMDWIAALRAKGLIATMRIVACFNNKQDAIQCERELIIKISAKRALVNFQYAIQIA